jgi:hypothetical protein
MQTGTVSVRRDTVLFWAVVFVALCAVSHYSYPGFHAIAIGELFSIVIAFSVFTIAWNVRRTLGSWLSLVDRHSVSVHRRH